MTPAIMYLMTLILALLAHVDVPAPVPAVAVDGAGLAARIDACEGRVLFSYDTRPGVSGNGDRVTIDLNGTGRHTWSFGDWDRDAHLAPGPAWVLVDVRGGQVRDIDLAVGTDRRLRRRADHDLGRVEPGVAAAWLLDRVPTLPGDCADEAITAAVVSRDGDCAGALLALLDDRGLPDEVRGTAMMWLAHLAGEKLVSRAADLLDEDDESLDLREQALFALSLADDTRAVDRMLDVARNHRLPQLRRSALFCLARQDDGDPRVLALLEEILTTP